MATVGLFFGSDTGNTEAVAKSITRALGYELVELHDISKCSAEDIAKFDRLILGIPTWGYGEAQSDWDDFLPNLESINFTGKLVAIFGCGDQEDYAQWFLDAMGILGKIVEARGATIVGHWPTAGYTFEASKALVDESHFIGLGIDQDRQPELTSERVNTWCDQLRAEMKLP